MVVVASVTALELILAFSVVVPLVGISDVFVVVFSEVLLETDASLTAGVVCSGTDVVVVFVSLRGGSRGGINSGSRGMVFSAITSWWGGMWQQEPK